MQTQNMDPQAKEYFNSLPQVLRSQIIESGAKLSTREELEAYAKNVLGGQPPQSCQPTGGK